MDDDVDIIIHDDVGAPFGRTTAMVGFVCVDPFGWFIHVLDEHHRIVERVVVSPRTLPHYCISELVEATYTLAQRYPFARVLVLDAYGAQGDLVHTLLTMVDVRAIVVS